ncbi:hypothetical protein BXY51_000964 [Actinoplanes cyaneus]|nr:hypothetical protein [Actinoplanes cyaneus]
MAPRFCPFVSAADAACRVAPVERFSALTVPRHGGRPGGVSVLGAPAPCSARKGPRGSSPA